MPEPTFAEIAAVRTNGAVLTRATDDIGGWVEHTPTGRRYHGALPADATRLPTFAEMADMARLAENRGVWAMWATGAAVVLGIAAVWGWRR